MGIVGSALHGTIYVTSFLRKSISSALTFFFQVITEWPNPALHLVVILTLLILSKWQFNHYFVLTLLYTLVFCDLLFFYWLLAYLLYVLVNK